MQKWVNKRSVSGSSDPIKVELHLDERYNATCSTVVDGLGLGWASLGATQ